MTKVMDPEHEEWTMERLLLEAEGAVTHARGANAQMCTLPAGFPVDRVRQTTDETWASQIQRVHPDDRPSLVKAWNQSLRSPAVPVRNTCRLVVDGATKWTQNMLLNLIDDERFGVVFVFRRDIEPPGQPADGVKIDLGRVQAKPWILQHIATMGAVLHTEGDTGVIFGRSPADLVGRRSLEAVHPDDQRLVLTAWLELLADPGGTRTIRHRIVHPDDRSVWVESTFINHVAHRDGCVLVISHDIDADLRREAALEASERRFRILADEMPMGVFEADADGNIVYGNARFLRKVTGEGTSLLALVHDAAAPAVAAAWGRLLDGHLPDGLALDVDARDGRVLRLRGQLLRGPDARASVIGSVDDVTVSVHNERALRQEADTDPLTGSFHRSGLRRAWDAMKTEGLAVLFIDLDGFKEVNDRYGHSAGDLVLIEVAQRLKRSVRPHDFVARYGGDEFVVVVPDVWSEPGARKLLRRTRAEIEGPIVLPGESTVWAVRASVGCSLARSGEDLDEVVARADADMYDEKRRRAARSGVLAKY